MLELDQVRIHRDGRDILRIDRLNIQPHEITVVLGHNGSGKSTLMKLLARQIPPDTGTIRLNGKSLNRYSQRRLAQEIAYLPQRLPEVAGLNVRELVRLGRFCWRGTFGRWRTEDVALIQAAMEQTDVAQYAEHLTDQLSGGERQRAWIAMLLAQQSPLLLLDEPTSALDLGHQYDLMSLLSRLNQETGRGVVIILHDINLATRFADRIIALHQGRLLFDGDADSLLSTPLLTELYGIGIHVVEHPTRRTKIAVVA